MKKLLYTALLLASIAAGNSCKAQATAQASAQTQKTQHPKQAMPDAQAATILAAMQQKGTDAEKVKVLQAGVKDNGITVAQLTPLLNQFAADDAKLICAKFAYPYTVDYKAYDKILDLFGKEESKRELERFIGKSN